MDRGSCTVFVASNLFSSGSLSYILNPVNENSDHFIIPQRRFKSSESQGTGTVHGQSSAERGAAPQEVLTAGFQSASHSHISFLQVTQTHLSKSVLSLKITVLEERTVNVNHSLYLKHTFIKPISGLMVLLCL